MPVSAQPVRTLTLSTLHRRARLLVLPNAWDCVSARLFEQAGFPAIATTSGGIAAVLGYRDGQHIPCREMLVVAGRIAATVAVPVTADLEAGYGKTPAGVAETMRQAIDLGMAGANLEDGRGPRQPLVDIGYQIDVIRAIREAAAAGGDPFVLNARVDEFLHGVGDQSERFRKAVTRAVAYREAGADCVFPIGLKDRDAIARFVREVGCPVNIMAGPGAPSLAELEQLGVRRVSFGTGPMRAVVPFVQQLARQLHTTGYSDLLEQTEFSHATINALFKQ